MRNQNMRAALASALIVLGFALGSIAPAAAQVSVGINTPGISIGINLPVFPQLVRVPGYPVYYAPQVNSNYFFYDGMYWVYQDDNWYASTWYNGPWDLVSPDLVPLFILRVPVRYYREPPSYFRGWSSNAAPRWGDHWGNTWAQRRGGWDNWNRSAVPAPAPLPVYQRQYSGSRYPRADEQRTLESRNYHYQPRDAVAQQHFQAQRTQASAPAASPRVTQQTREAHGAQQPQRGAGAPSSRPRIAGAPRDQASPSRNGDQRIPVAGKAPSESRVQAARPERPQRPQVATQRKPAQEPRATMPAQAQRPEPSRQQAQQRAAPERQQQAQQRAAPERQQPAQQRAAPERQQQARAQGEAKASQGKEPAKESKQGPEKGREKPE